MWVWNADLIKKGLRPIAGVQWAHELCLKRRPDQKGIKTDLVVYQRAIYIVWNADLIKKGLRPPRVGSYARCQYVWNADLIKKGLRPILWSIDRFALVWNADLIKKGLRRERPLLLAAPWGLKRRPDQKGIKTGWTSNVSSSPSFETQTWSKRD